MKNNPAPVLDHPPVRFHVYILLVLVLAALLLRMVVLSRSLWYDEIYTVLHFAGRDWGAIVAGEYSPNNHILSSLLVKACDVAGSRLGVWKELWHTPAADGLWPVMPQEGTLRFRLPSMLAGTMAALALAWPLRPRGAVGGLWPLVVLAAIGMVQPWLLAFSTEARGYALLLMLAILATNLLPDLRRARWVGYVLLMTAAMYTIPLAGTLLVGHGVALLWLNRAGLKRWLPAALASAGAAALLYLPFLSQMTHSAAGMKSPLSYGAFLGQTLRYAITGWNTLGWLAATLAVVVLAVGLPLAWRETRLRVAAVSFAVCSAIALLLPAVFPATGQPRFVFWLIPLMVFACYGLVRGWPGTAAMSRALGVGAGIALAGWMAWQAVALTQVPPQPILEGIAALDRAALAGAGVIGAYVGTLDSYILYQPAFGERNFFTASTAARYREQRAADPGAWTLVVYPDLLAKNVPEMDAMVRGENECVLDLWGRYSDVRVYQPRVAERAK